jgi:hypothetical protein
MTKCWPSECGDEDKDELQCLLPVQRSMGKRMARTAFTFSAGILNT